MFELRELRPGIPPAIGRRRRDALNVYLATSRDGLHYDLGWIGRGAPLVPPGAAPIGRAPVTQGQSQSRNSGAAQA